MKQLKIRLAKPLEGAEKRSYVAFDLGMEYNHQAVSYTKKLVHHAFIFHFIFIFLIISWETYIPIDKWNKRLHMIFFLPLPMV